MKKINSVQLIAILLCSRVFSLMTYFPYNYSNPLIYMTGMAISTILQGLVVLPAVIFCQREYNDNPCTLVSSRNRTWGIIFTLLYLGWFIYASFYTIGDFGYYMDYYFTGNVPRIMSVACLIPAAIYVGQMKIGIIGKTAVYAGAGFLLLTIIVLGGSMKDLHLFNFHLAEENVNSVLWQSIKAEFQRSESLITFAFLMPQYNRSSEKGTEKRSPAKVIWIYLAAKLVLLELIIFFITVILGDFSAVTKQPFFSLVSYSHTEIIERYDALFLFVWVIITVVKLAVYIYCCTKCISIICPKATHFASSAVSAVIPAAAALFMLIPHKWEKLVHTGRSAAAIIALTAVLPVIALLFAGKGGFSAGEKTS